MATPATQQADTLPTIALVGRVNVGKSTLFNRLIEENKAMVSDTPGTTRTSNEGLILWRGKQIRIIDTGGLTFTDDVPLEADIMKQSERAMKVADIIVFVTDAKSGVLPQEFELAKHLRRIIEKPVLLVANKADNSRIEKQLFQPEWYKLGLGEPFPLSAASGRNVGDFLDIVYKILQKSPKRPKTIKTNVEKPISISLIGKPNVGKSSLFNKLIGEDKVIVSDMAHTTREPHDTLITYEHSVEGKKVTQPITFIDTAGIRRKGKVSGALEKEGIHKSIESIKHSDIVLFVIDATEPVSSQDLQLAGHLEQHGKSVIIIVNKWDLTDDTSDTHRNEVKKTVHATFPHLDFAPIILTSGKTGYAVHTIFPEIIHVWQARQIKVPVKALEYFLKQATTKHKPSRGKGTRHPELMGIRQINEAPPMFEIFVKYRTSLHRSYIDYLKNKMREQFDFYGTPIILRLTKMKR